MATKNKILLIVGILFVIVIALFIIKIISAEKLTSTAVDDMKLKNALDNNPSSVILYGFDEKKYDISDEKDIETIIDTLKNVSYKEKDQQGYEEGFYLMDINYGSETVSLGIGSDCFSYEGVQYETEKGSLDKVVNIFVKYLEWIEQVFISEA